LAARKQSDDLKCIVAHALSVREKEAVEKEVARFRGEVYRFFTQYVYSRLPDDDPAEDDSDSMHFPYPIPRVESLERCAALGPEVETELLDGLRFARLYRRVAELCLIEEDEEQ
jgi:hypothetical protein